MWPATSPSCWKDEDIGRLHLVLYDLLYEGHEDTLRLQ
jgi:hypothetical protein